MRQLEYAIQFTSQIRFLVGKDNIVADKLSRLKVHGIGDVPFPDFKAMAAAQNDDLDLFYLRSSHTALQLQKTQLVHYWHSL